MAGRRGRLLASTLCGVLASLGLAPGVSLGQTAAEPPSPESPGDLDSVLVDAVSSKVPTFGGASVDGDGALVVWLTRPTRQDAEDARRALAAAMPRAGIEARSVRVRHADFSFAELKGWFDSALSDIFAESGVSFVDIDDSRNRLLVAGRDRDSLDIAMDAIAQRHGIPREAILVEDATAFKPTLSDRVRPIVGGTQIQFQTGFLGVGTGTCTLGFNAVRSGVEGFVTNSHCSRTRGEVDNGRYWQPTRPFLDNDQVGTEIADPPFFTGGSCPANRRCRFSDANFVDAATNINRGRVARPPIGSTNWNGTDTFRITSEAGTFVGDIAQKVGRTTGRSQGLITHFCVAVVVDNTDITMLCQHIVEAAVDPGDSGSPVITAPPGTDVGLLGVLWGEGTINLNEVFVYSGINGIETELGSLTTCAAGFSC